MGVNGGWNEEMQKRKMSMFMIFMDAKEVRGMRSQTTRASPTVQLRGAVAAQKWSYFLVPTGSYL
jgi:hypothetical protein